MKHVKVKIRGISPLLMHKPPDDLGENKANRGVAGNGDTTPKEVAEASIYKSDNNACIVPATWVLGSIIDGGSFEKIGRRKVSTARTSLIPAAVLITEEYMTLHSKDGWTVDSRPVTIPATGGRVMRHRPKWQDWSLEFTMQIDTDVLNTDMIRRCIDHAGSKIGLGDFRPARRGPFGRFVVDLWKEEKAKV